LLRQNIPKGFQHQVGFRISKAQEIKIASAAVRIVKPTHHQHRPLQNEATGVGRLAESKQ
jgi:hypothetical protein